MDISFIIVNWNTKELLIKSIESILTTVKGIGFEIWVVDNASEDGSPQAVKQLFPNVNIIQNSENKGFAAANNQAFRSMKGRYALLLNSDAQLTEGACLDLFSFMEKTPSSGMCCGQLMNPDGTKQNSIANFPTLFSLMANETLLRIVFPETYPSKRRSYTEPIEIESGIGACLMIRKEALDSVGAFDEDYFFFFEETDLALRMRKNGWKVFFVPDAKIFHEQGKSAGKSAKPRIMFYSSRYIYLRKWHPERFGLMSAVIFSRLLVNAVLSMAGTILTLGLSPGIRSKNGIYLKIIAWHMKGCKT